LYTLVEMEQEVSLPFYRPALDRSVVTLGHAALAEVAMLLGDGRVNQLAWSGQLALAIVRPGLDRATLLENVTDCTAAETIESMLTTGAILAKFSCLLDAGSVQALYEDKSHGMMQLPALFDTTAASRWEELVGIMTGGPATVLLLHGPDAVEHLRTQLGHWNVDQERDPATIRGLLAISGCNNLVHASDSPAAVVYELGILRDCVLKQIAQP
jgi:nucleoside diphosphate kinase